MDIFYISLQWFIDLLWYFCCMVLRSNRVSSSHKYLFNLFNPCSICCGIVWLITLIVISASNGLFNAIRADSSRFGADSKAIGVVLWQVSIWGAHAQFQLARVHWPNDRNHVPNRPWQDATNGKQAYPIKSLYSN